MTQQQALDAIAEALRKALNIHQVEFSLETDLIEAKILDSLDSMVFLLELAQLTGTRFPEDKDLVEAGLFKADRLVSYLTGTISL